jgi:hypothetical protein
MAVRRHLAVTKAKIVEIIVNKLSRIEQEASGGRKVGLRTKDHRVRATIPRRPQTRFGHQVASRSRTPVSGLPAKYALVSNSHLQRGLFIIEALHD